MGGLIEHYGNPLISQGMQQTTSTFEIGGVVQQFSSPTGNPVSNFGNPLVPNFGNGGKTDGSFISGFMEKYKHKLENKNYRNGGTTNDDTPKIYVADLAAYNNGRLEGFWLDLSEYDSGEEVQNKINEFLKKQSEKSGELREEVAIHDYENFPSSMYSEYMDVSDFDKIISAFKSEKDLDLPYEVVLEFKREMGVDSNEQVKEMFLTKTVSGSESDKELGKFYVELVGLNGVQNKEFYFNYADYGFDVRMDLTEEQEEAYEDLDDAELGEQMIEEMYNGNIPKNLLEKHFDFESLGNDLSINDYTCYSKDGYCYWFSNRYAKGGIASQGSNKIQLGDMVHVVAENRSGVVTNVISNGKHYSVKFVDGSKNIYDKNEIEKVRSEEDYDEYADGGEFGGGGMTESEINKLYSKTKFINDDFNWKLKLLEMLQDQSVEAYHIYQNLTAKQKNEVLQEQFELDNDMGSDGDGEIETSKENLEILLADAKNGKLYKRGGMVSKNLKRIVSKGTKYGKLAVKKAKPKAKKIIPKAKIGFDALAKKVAKSYVGKAVAKKYQSVYGKRYSKAEAQEVGNKVAAKVKRMKGM